ncbi:Zinc knuckle [Popillia japonica]|uniref:Zinc knuckle n=1 Tax=Popillia japonica TaxID=7064 RepID=A0AAW1IA78_POPJA
MRLESAFEIFAVPEDKRFAYLLHYMGMSNKKQHSPQNVGTSKVNVNSKNLKCFRCGSPKHLANKCDKQNLTCHKCKRKGHLSKVCIKSTGKVEQIEEICIIQAEHLQYRQKFTLSLKVENVKLHFEIDSGAAVTLLSFADFKRYFEQIEEICIIQAEHLQYRQKFTLSLKVENVKLHFEIDSGAAVTLLSFADFKRYFPKLQLRDTDIKLSTYCRNTLNVMGFTTVTEG